MKTIKYTIKAPLFLMIFALFIFDAQILNAQRMGGGGGGARGGGGGSSMSRPTSSPSTRQSMPTSRPSQSYGGGSASSRQSTSAATKQPSSYGGGSSSSRQSINGGSQKSPDRSGTRPATATAGTNTGNRAATKPISNSSAGGRDKGVSNDKLSGNKPSAGTSDRNKSVSGSRDKVDNGGRNDGNRSDGNRGDGNRGDGNRGDGNRGNGNFNNNNINVNNRGNTNINIENNYYGRPNSMPYYRPPYAYGGFHYNCYNPYYYHPYTPFYYGPAYHPWGFFLATITVTAIVVNANSQQYYYDNGIYYVQSNGGYTVVEAPAGVSVKQLPSEAQKVVVNETTNNYYYGGTYYEQKDGEYVVVPPTAGIVVDHLPDGGEEVKIGDVTYVKFGATYYQPIQKNGKNLYEVVDVEKAPEGEK